MRYQSLKLKAAQAALSYIKPNQIIGVGTGSTIQHFIALLAASKLPIKGAVASSNTTAHQLQASGIPLVSFNQVFDLPIYIDGADAIDANGHLIKGGGGALTREKLIATASQLFICIADESKWIPDFSTKQCPPLPVEVLPIACSYVSHELGKLGGHTVCRANFMSDNGNNILDVRGLDYQDPMQLESLIQQIPGVLENGLFAKCRPNYVLLASDRDVKTIVMK
jgi:ribose 5-phosphate isomerase A